MFQTLTGWILFTCVLLSGISAGYTAAGMLENALGDGTVARRELITLLTLVALMVAAGLLLFWTEGR